MSLQPTVGVRLKIVSNVRGSVIKTSGFIDPYRVEEVELAPFQSTAGRAVCGIVGIGLHALHVANMLNPVDGAEAAVTGPRAGDEPSESSHRLSHLGFLFSRFLRC